MLNPDNVHAANRAELLLHAQSDKNTDENPKKTRNVRRSKQEINKQTNKNLKAVLSPKKNTTLNAYYHMALGTAAELSSTAANERRQARVPSAGHVRLIHYHKTGRRLSHNLANNLQSFFNHPPTKQLQESGIKRKACKNCRLPGCTVPVTTPANTSAIETVGVWTAPGLSLPLGVPLNIPECSPPPRIPTVVES